MKRFSETAIVMAAAFVPAVAPAASLDGLSWNLSKGAAISGSTLTAEIAEAGGPQCAGKAAVDLSGLIGEGLGLVFTVRVRAAGVTKPDHPWNGVKFMLSYKDASTGAMRHPGAAVPGGSYGWRVVTNRVNELTAPFSPVDGKATVCLGLQGCTGRVEFDLASLSVFTEDVGVRPVNQDYTVKYRDAAGRANLRGCMLPARDTTEEDVADLAEWGATLGRFQIERNWSEENGNRDLAEYAAWVDSRLDNLADVLRWAGARGMKIAVDLHSPPGGKRRVDGVRTMNMFFEAKYADAFVETWRRIARRFKGNAAVYGYDLVNEPDHRVPVPFSYWELQRRAAEAIREIDPDATIVVESNLSDNAEAYRYLSPLAMDNVVYQLHLYKPYEYTHQGVWGNPTEKNGRPLSWPDHARGWTADHLRRVLAPVRAFQKKHKCRVYVGEFSAASWAPGAENYLRDCIAVFEEYGWNWTYHAFREWGAWSVEHEAVVPGRAGKANFIPSADNPRKRALLDGLRLSNTTPKEKP